jgi:hypothetical protein
MRGELRRRTWSVLETRIGVTRSRAAFVRALCLSSGGLLLLFGAEHRRPLEKENVGGREHERVQEQLECLFESGLQICLLEACFDQGTVRGQAQSVVRGTWESKLDLIHASVFVLLTGGLVSAARLFSVLKCICGVQFCPSRSAVSQERHVRRSLISKLLVFAHSIRRSSVLHMDTQREKVSTKRPF